MMSGTTSASRTQAVITRLGRSALLALAVALSVLISTTSGDAELPRAALEQDQTGTARTVEGIVTKVDGPAGMIRVAWGPFGLFSTTLEVGDQTRIRVVGRPAELEDLREGATVRASYQSAGGRNVAQSIDLVLAPIVSAGRTP